MGWWWWWSGGGGWLQNKPENCTATLPCKIRLNMQKKLKKALMKMKRQRDANNRAKNSSKNETHLNSYKETNHKDMIERTISLINVRKKEKKNELRKNCYTWILKLIHDESL